MNPDSVTVTAIEDGLATRGFHVVREPLAIGSFYHLAKLLGSVVRIEDIRLGATRRGAHSSHELGLHTDQHYVDVIAWYCVKSAPVDGATLLVDTAPYLASLAPNERERLTRVTMRCPDVDGLNPPAEVPLLRPTLPRDRVYYAAWNVAPLPDLEVNAAFKRFSAAVESAPRIAVRLEAAECLFLDNTRMLHGRGQLPADSPRVLKRFWIQRAAPAFAH